MGNIAGAVIFVIFGFSLHSPQPATGFGSRTYETNNGFPINFLQDITNSDVVKKKLTSRWKWEVWDVVPGSHAYQLYLFNVTNPDDVERGGKPALNETGPYYYKEYRFKFDVSINLDLSVNFVRNFTYNLDPQYTHGVDTVNVINVPLIVFATLAAKYGGATKANQAISELVAGGESLVIRNVKVDDILFHGLDVSKYKKYLDLMGPSTWLTDEFREGRYGVLKLKTGVHEGSFTVDSGLKSERLVGDIVQYNEKPTLSYWKADSCNEIKGSDGSVFPPHLGTSDKLYMLEVDLCRSVYFEYARDMQFKQVLGHIYAIGKGVLEDPAVNTDNACFCTQPEGGCLKKGVLDVSSCQFGAPIVMSFAHFLDASPEYQEGVTGLSPDPKLHQTRVTVEPVTGAVINFHKRYQWNVWIKPLPGLDYFKKFKPVMVPILWNDDIFTLDADKEELLMEELASQAGGMGGTSSKTQFSLATVFSLLLVILCAQLIVRN